MTYCDAISGQECDDVESTFYGASLHELGHCAVAAELNLGREFKIEIGNAVRGGGKLRYRRSSPAHDVMVLMAGELIQELVGFADPRDGCSTDRKMIAEYGFNDGVLTCFAG